MNKKIVEMLHLSLEPVGIFLGNTSAIKLWEEMLKDSDKSCLTTHSWKKIEGRL